MPQMNNAQARVVDPILTNVARGYKNEALASTHLFPIVPVGQRGGKILTFGTEDFAAYATGRAPGSNIRRINFGHDGDPYALEQNALEGQVPVEHLEEAGEVPGIDLSSVAVNKTMAAVQLGIESKAAKLATNAANYDAENTRKLTTTSKWSHDDSKPAKDIKSAKRVISGKIGLKPNTLILGPKPFDALTEHPDVMDRIKYTSSASVDEAILARYFGVDKVIVAESFAGEPGSFESLWGNNVVLAYTEVGSLAGQGTPSYGYTYRLKNYPVVTQGYYEENTRSWIYPVVTEDTPVIAGADAGFLFQTVA